jgi:hypothetical protein
MHSVALRPNYRHEASQKRKLHDGHNSFILNSRFLMLFFGIPSDSDFGASFGIDGGRRMSNQTMKVHEQPWGCPGNPSTS